MNGKVSIHFKILEGCAHQSQADYFKSLNIAFESLREQHCQVSLAKRLGFLPDQNFFLTEAKIIETENILNNLIKTLRDS